MYRVLFVGSIPLVISVSLFVGMPIRHLTRDKWLKFRTGYAQTLTGSFNLKAWHNKGRVKYAEMDAPLPNNSRGAESV